MKSIFLGLSAALSIALFTSSASAYCLFGNNLVQTARMADLKFSAAKVITPQTSISEKELRHILKGTQTQTLAEAFEFNDDGRIYAHSINDTAHSHAYKMYVYSLGGNFVGFFVNEANDQLVAEISDGTVVNCSVDFESYDTLPWFYTN